MTIAEAREKCKSLVAKAPRDILVLAILILASLLSFGLGYLTGLDAPVPISSGALSQPTDTLNVQSISAEGRVVASKSGTKYYLPSCAGANRISDANKVWFTSAEAAEVAGYAPASNCK